MARKHLWNPSEMLTKVKATAIQVYFRLIDWRCKHFFSPHPPRGVLYGPGVKIFSDRERGWKRNSLIVYLWSCRWEKSWEELFKWQQIFSELLTPSTSSKLLNYTKIKFYTWVHTNLCISPLTPKGDWLLISPIIFNPESHIKVRRIK